MHRMVLVILRKGSRYPAKLKVSSSYLMVKVDNSNMVCYNDQEIKKTQAEVFSMKCPYCGYQESKVVDSRHSEETLPFAAEENVCPARRDLQPMRSWSVYLWLLSKKTAAAKPLTK